VEGVRERWSPGRSAASGLVVVCRGRWEVLRQDTRHAWRSLLRSPAFSAAVVGILALGIAASVAIFTLLDALVLRGVPFDQAGSLVVVRETYQEPGGPLEERAVSYPAYRDWSEQTSAFEALAVTDFAPRALVVEEGPAVPLGVEHSSSSLSRVLRVGASPGRWYTEEEDAASARVVVLSHALWRSRFSADAAVVGQSVLLEGVPFEVVGVAEAGFTGAFGGVDAWIPIRSSLAFAAPSATGDFDRRGWRGYFVIGRIRQGVSLAEAQMQIDRIAVELQASGALAETRGAQVQSFRARSLGDAGRDVWLLFGAAGLVLLIACANVANLLLARQLARRREIALRRALGAGSGDIVRRLLAESLLLGLAGGAAALLLAPMLMRLLADANLAGVPDYIAPTLNRATIVFALAVSIGTALVFGSIPAGSGVRVGLMETMRAGSRGSTHGGGRGSIGRRLLVVAQLGIAVPLLVGAGLLLQSIMHQSAIDPGFDAQGVVGAEINLPAARYTFDEARQFADRLTQTLEQDPLIAGVAIASDIPIQSGYRATMIDVEDPGQPPRAFRVYVHNVSAGYFELLRMKLLDGRTFDSRDAAGAAEVVVLSEKAAQRFWPGEQAVGKRIEGAEVIGVVGDAAFRTLLPDPVENPDDPDIFLAFAQYPTTAQSVLLRARGAAPDALVDRLRDAVHTLDPALPVQANTTLTAVLNAETAASRALARELVAFAVAALLLAAAGLYGIMAYTVSQRAPEIGVRMALGAARGRVLFQVLRQGLQLVVAGTGAGLLVALAGGRVLRNQLYGVAATDVWTYAAVVAVLASAGALASWFPARRATRLDPMRVLKES
jgi:predicted permease